TLAETTEGIYTFGNSISDIRDYDKSWAKKAYNQHERLIAVDPKRKMIPIPEGNFTFSFPKAVADSNGIIHLLWVEPDSSDKKAGQYASIWYASYDDGQWSGPTKIYQTHSMWWRHASRFCIDN